MKSKWHQILERHHALWFLRPYNRFRRHTRRRWANFCTIHPYCFFCNLRRKFYQRWLDLRAWMHKETMRGRENVLMTNSHFWLWRLTAWWLIVLGIHLINVNFPFFNIEQFYGPIQTRYAIVNFFLKYAIWIVAYTLFASLREYFHEMFRIPADHVRASKLTKRWLIFVGLFQVYCWATDHPAVYPHAVSEVSYMFFAMFVVKTGIRKIRVWMKLPVGAVPTSAEKKAQSVIQGLLKFLVRARTK